MKNLKIKFKLILLVGFLLIAMLGVGVFSMINMDKINMTSTEMATNSLPSTDSAHRLNTLSSDYRLQEFAHILSTSQEDMASREKAMDEIGQDIQNEFSRYRTLVTNDTDRALIESMISAWDNYLKLSDQMLTESRENRQASAMSAMQGESTTTFDAFSEEALKLVEFNVEAGNQASAEGDSLYSQTTKVMIGVIIAVIIAAVLISIYIVRSIIKPVSEIDYVAQKIADGQLNESIAYESRDELGVLAKNFNKTVMRLREYVNYIDEISSVLDEIGNGNLVFELTYDYAGEFAKVKTALMQISDSLNDAMGEINHASDQVSSGADQVSSSSQALSQGAAEQASSVEELAATINEISNQVKENASNAQSASDKMDTLGQEIQYSNEQMQSMTTAMNEISSTSGEIGKIIKTIEDIAFQTNILALNAAVEAARAGAAGKGFAVVADEVRNLASKSAEAASNTTALIENSLKAVEDGNRIAGETAGSLAKVVDEAHSVIDVVNKISQASQNQAESLGQVTVGIDQISSVVQTNSATAEESAAASEELSGQAQMLKDQVRRFRLRD